MAVSSGFLKLHLFRQASYDELKHCQAERLIF